MSGTTFAVQFKGSDQKDVPFTGCAPVHYSLKALRFRTLRFRQRPQDLRQPISVPWSSL